MSFLEAGGVSKWSQIPIDADKDMLGFGLTDLKELVLNMTTGDIIYFNGVTGKLDKLSPGPLGTELLTKGPTLPPKYGFPDSG